MLSIWTSQNFCCFVKDSANNNNLEGYYDIDCIIIYYPFYVFGTMRVVSVQKDRHWDQARRCYLMPLPCVLEEIFADLRCISSDHIYCMEKNRSTFFPKQTKDMGAIESLGCNWCSNMHQIDA